MTFEENSGENSSERFVCVPPPFHLHVLRLEKMLLNFQNSLEKKTFFSFLFFWLLFLLRDGFFYLFIFFLHGSGQLRLTVAPQRFAFRRVQRSVGVTAHEVGLSVRPAAVVTMQSCKEPSVADLTAAHSGCLFAC